jgi:outer membrane lipoprotein-sorting protein
VLIVTPAVHLYRPEQKKVEIFDTIKDKDIVLKYILLGFQPRGSDLKRSYDVELVREDELATGNALLFTLTPKLLKKAVPTISGIMLWIDEISWLPAQLIIRREGGQQITVRYGAMTEQQELPADTFRADWPADTAIITER